MKFMKQAQQLAAELSRQFGSDEIIFSAQMRQGDDWITLELYRNEEDPHRLHAVMDFDTGGNILLQTEKSPH
ncbi:MAG: hypothetical protein ACTHYN_15340 [Marinobacter sp.]|uniref:hypothetical protein n=1 Tax=Marinobacter sp. TaxID=50741 RepID=UPI003F9AC7F4